MYEQHYRTRETNDYSKLENEDEVLKTKSDEFKLFYYYVKKIHTRCRKAGYTQGRTLWEDFPYDFYEDVERWIKCNTVKEIKEVIDEVKEYHPIVKESAMYFWQHWLAYKHTTNKQKLCGKLKKN